MGLSMAMMAVLSHTGCIWLKESPQKLELGVEERLGPLAKSAAYRDTIGSKTVYQGMAPMRVRGYGLVVGLGNNGSSDCPRPVYDRLIEALYKQHSFSSSVVGSRTISPERLIRDEDTAVVLVRGEIPPGAVAGSRFDVGVMAWPGTQTKSLRGGRLYTSDLHIYTTVAPNTTLSGQMLAKAAGPVFLNPFSEGDAATQSSQLEGVILGGGLVTQDRRIRLVLTQPSYAISRRIQDRINAFFPGSHKIATAMSQSIVQLSIPREFRGDEAHFFGLVRSLYLSRDPHFSAVRARALAREIIQPSAPHAQIAQCFEGLGRAALPALDGLYAHTKDYVSFHAAVAGFRLGDHVAGDVMTTHAEESGGAFRFQAIHALGEARDMAATGMALRRLLDDEDPRIQVAAYEALLERDDPIIETVVVGGDNFLLDRVPTQRPSFVYVRRKETRRIAIFGDDLKASPPVLYRAPDGSVTITAEPDADTLTVLRVVLHSGSVSPPVPASLELTKLILLLGHDADIDADGNVIGLSLDYAAVVRAIYALCKSGAIGASFVLEQPNAAELFGPPRVTGRPESEL